MNFGVLSVNIVVAELLIIICLSRALLAPSMSKPSESFPYLYVRKVLFFLQVKLK
jgi:hypothetical protein